MTGSKRALLPLKDERGAYAQPLDQEDVDKLADIIWWIRGAQAADPFSDACPFDEYHVRALRRARLLGMGHPRKDWDA